MIIILALIILVAAVIVSVAGALANGGQGHQVTHFAVFGYHVTGSTGTVFLYGIVVGALAVAGLSMLLAGARRTSRRGREARRGLAQSRRQTAAVSADRDNLIDQRDSGSNPRPRRPVLSHGLFGRRPAQPQVTRQPEPPVSQVPVSAGSPTDTAE